MLTDREHHNFWRKVRVNADSGCWEWTAALTPAGYGVFGGGTGRVQHRAHRLAYAIYHGVQPGVLLVCHTCDNRICVRKEHLFLGTHQDNVNDMCDKGRQAHARGTDNGRHKFSDETVGRVHALRAEGWLQKWIARELQMTQQHVSKILNKKTRSPLAPYRGHR